MTTGFSNKRLKRLIRAILVLAVGATGGAVAFDQFPHFPWERHKRREISVFPQLPRGLMDSTQIRDRVTQQAERRVGGGRTENAKRGSRYPISGPSVCGAKEQGQLARQQ